MPQHDPGRRTTPGENRGPSEGTAWRAGVNTTTADPTAAERDLLLAGAFPLVGGVIARALAARWPTVTDLRSAAVELHREARRLELAADRVDELTAELIEAVAA